MQLKKLSLMIALVVLTGTVLSGCSLKEKIQDMAGTTEPNPVVSVSPAAMQDESSDMVVTPMPSQSSSSEVNDLELDLKMVKFDQESFE